MARTTQTKKQPPQPSKVTGGQCEQLSFLPPPPLSPLMPSLHSKAWLALYDMLHGPVNQIDWLKLQRGWRLAAAVKELRYLGWQCADEWTQPAGCAARIKQYELTPQCRVIAAEKLHQAKGVQA